ncbi:MAG TPA: replication factor C small subunit [Thermoplasmata archaeon]|nr:replication factor C small subunit [Thermoplasmata archaeon]
MFDIWIEKYRPRKIRDMVGQRNIVERLQSYVEKRTMPHLLFAGPAGTGKTTGAIALARELFGENWRENFLELNASDERGINIVRGKIKEFARIAPFKKGHFKIIFLDEADALTQDAQAALRRTMERYTQSCRFILSCNYSSKIIEPIQSRCAVFRFKPLTKEEIISYIEKIAEKEGLSLTQDAKEAIAYLAGGDMRKAINALQVASTLSHKIDEELLYKVSATAKPEDIKALIKSALVEADFLKARQVLDTMLIDYGLSGEDVVRQIHSHVFSLNIPDIEKVRLIEKIGEIEFRMVEGSNERIQLESLLAYLVLIGREYQPYK